MRIQKVSWNIRHIIENFEEEIEGNMMIINMIVVFKVGIPKTNIMHHSQICEATQMYVCDA